MEMITVLLPTHNGADTLSRTLEAFCALDEPVGGWKLVLINNASTDKTEQIVSLFSRTLPIEYVNEPKLGKGNALNAGIHHASGDAIIFCDDDVIPRADWLVAWRSGIDRHEDCAVFGGSVEPLYESSPPSWLAQTDWERVLYAKTDPLPEGPIEPTGSIFGLNMAVRTSALSSGVRFDETLLIGPAGLMGDETDFIYRLAAAGHRACFVPGAVVRHIVQKPQLSRRWMLKRFFRHGRTMFLFQIRHSQHRPPQMFRAPRFLFRRLAGSAISLPWAFLSGNELRIYSNLRQMAYDLGAIAQARELSAEN